MDSSVYFAEAARVLCGIMIASILIQTLMALRYVWALLRFRRPHGDASYCPKAFVILCVKGRDARMEDTLRSLFQQDYPDYDVRVIVDSRNDPGWDLVHAVAAETGAKNVYIEALTHRRSTCVRKISALLQGLKGLDPSHKAILMLDSDARPHATWIRELVAPLADPKVGAASGNRWYMPDTPSWGGLACYAWNAAAVVQMYLYRITWGGSLAINREVFEEVGMFDRWPTSFGDDTALCQMLIAHGYDVVYVPTVPMVNRSVYDMAGLLNFVERQLLCVRMENPWWKAVVAHGLSTSALIGAALVTILTGVLAQEWAAAIYAAVGLGVYMLGCGLLIAMLECAIRPVIKHRGDETRWLSFTTVLKLTLAVPLAQAVHLVGLLCAIFTTTHNWRNVIYRLGGSPRVSVIGDKAA